MRLISLHLLRRRICPHKLNDSKSHISPLPWQKMLILMLIISSFIFTKICCLLTSCEYKTQKKMNEESTKMYKSLEFKTFSQQLYKKKFSCSAQVLPYYIIIHLRGFCWSCDCVCGIYWENPFIRFFSLCHFARPLLLDHHQQLPRLLRSALL